MTVRYAVLLKVHYWDDFVARRIQHLLRKVGTGDVFVFVDETHGPVGEIPHDRVVRATERDMAELGLTLYPAGKVFWYNVDYPLYYFYARHKSYDYYIMCEHDAVLNLDVDAFVNRAAADQVDYVGFPIAQSPWPLSTAEGVYPKSFSLHQWLSCISLHSRRSVEFLLDRRQAQGRRYAAREISNWPNNEVFIPSEMLNNGFVVRQLGDFGKAEKYDWWPPSREDDLPALQDQAFLHPVLDRRRYIVSCLRFTDMRTYFSPDGQLHQLLAKESGLAILPAFIRELARRSLRKLVPTSLVSLVRPNHWSPESPGSAASEGR